MSSSNLTGVSARFAIGIYDNDAVIFCQPRKKHKLDIEQGLFILH